MKRTSRETWRRRVLRWQASGRTAEEFAAGRGFKAGTLRHWKWLLGAEGRGRKAKRRKAAPPFVEIVRAADLVGHGDETASADAPPESFELLFEDPLLLRIPARFDPVALRRLLRILERR